MNLSTLLNLLPKHPQDILLNGSEVKVSESCFYLYAIYNVHDDFFESTVSIFPTTKDFVKFLPAIIFNRIAYCWEDYQDEEEDSDHDYSSEYNFYVNSVKELQDFEDCVAFVKKYPVFDEMELIEFGRVSDLIDVAKDEYMKCKEILLSLDELEGLGLSQGRYQIFHAFHQQSKNPPSMEKEQFLAMLENWDGG